MEIRKETVQIEMSFEAFETAICKTDDGVILTDEEDNEMLYRKKDINNLFCLANENTIKEITYINDEQDIYAIDKIYITLNNSRKYIVERL